MCTQHDIFFCCILNSVQCVLEAGSQMSLQFLIAWRCTLNEWWAKTVVMWHFWQILQIDCHTPSIAFVMLAHWRQQCRIHKQHQGFRVGMVFSSQCQPAVSGGLSNHRSASLQSALRFVDKHMCALSNPFTAHYGTILRPVNSPSMAVMALKLHNARKVHYVCEVYVFR